MEAKKKFLLELHSIIKERSMIGNLLSNPPQDLILEKFNLTDTELNALKAQQFTHESISGIEKIVRNNLMAAFFNFNFSCTINEFFNKLIIDSAVH
jgi:hypothetical protein